MRISFSASSTFSLPHFLLLFMHTCVHSCIGIVFFIPLLGRNHSYRGPSYKPLRCTSKLGQAPRYNPHRQRSTQAMVASWWTTTTIETGSTRTRRTGDSKWFDLNCLININWSTIRLRSPVQLKMIDWIVWLTNLTSIDIVWLFDVDILLLDCSLLITIVWLFDIK